MRGVAPLLTGCCDCLDARVAGPLGWTGMLLISLGVIALALRPARLGPALHGHGRAVGFALANAVVIAVYTIIDGSGARLAGNAWSYIVCCSCWMPFPSRSTCWSRDGANSSVRWRNAGGAG